MLQAARVLIDCVRVLARTGDNVVSEVLRGCGTFTEWEHYPAEDVYDRDTHVQYYYHAHPGETRRLIEHGHFHLFLHPKGMPRGLTPAPVADLSPAGEKDALSHLVAISMDRYGMPQHIFTTNRWVTGETWYQAADVIAMLDRFAVDVVRPNLVVSRWIAAVICLFRPAISALLIERDDVIARWEHDHPSRNVFENRELEITSIVRIDLEDRIREIAL